MPRNTRIPAAAVTAAVLSLTAAGQARAAELPPGGFTRCVAALARYALLESRPAGPGPAADPGEEAGAAYLASGCPAGPLLAARQSVQERLAAGRDRR